MRSSYTRRLASLQSASNGEVSIKNARTSSLVSKLFHCLLAPLSSFSVCEGIRKSEIFEGYRENSFDVELIDSELWRLSFGLAHSFNGGRESYCLQNEEDNEEEIRDCSNESPSIEEIEDLRLHKMLFYKLDRSSREFEECNVNFRRKNSMQKNIKKNKEAHLKEENRKTKKRILADKSSRATNLAKKIKKKPDNKCRISIRNEESQSERTKQKKQPNSVRGAESDSLVEAVGDIGKVGEDKRKVVRYPTFNQLTDPYHLPFCLDIHITKGSVRACIVHRLTSKVVAVSHSISKDVRFDLTCRRDSNACIVVGKVLAQRAIEDDIYNVVYTPRKGDKLEGKHQLVVQSIIDHGVDIKMKLKQRRQVEVSSTNHLYAKTFPDSTVHEATNSS